MAQGVFDGICRKLCVYYDKAWKGRFGMTLTAQQGASMLERMEEQTQEFALNFLSRLLKNDDFERQQRNAEYVNKIDMSFSEAAEGKHVVFTLDELNALTTLTTEKAVEFLEYRKMEAGL